MRWVFPLILLALTSVPSILYGKTEPLYIIERDTLQTRNFTPVINHETMVVNLGQASLTVDLDSPIPQGKFVQGKFYPAFLEDSLLPEPIFSPVAITPKKTSYLARPEILTKGDKTSFIWKGVKIPAGEAMIGQYNNFLGKPEMYWTPAGLDIFGLALRTRYTALAKGASARTLSFEYEVENGTGSEISDLVLEVFVSVKRLGEGQGSPLLDLQEIAFSPNAEVSQMTKVDGFGQPAFGAAVTHFSRTLAAGARVRFFLRLSGSPSSHPGEIWPILTVRGRSLQKPVWPPTNVKTGTPVNQGRFSYVSYNLVIRDSRLIALSPKGAKVIPARNQGGDQ